MGVAQYIQSAKREKIMPTNNTLPDKIGEDVEKREPLCTVGRNVNWCSHYEKQYGGSSKIIKK